MSTELKVKVKSLAAESKIIRREENKAKANIRWLVAHDSTVGLDRAIATRDSLQGHRRSTVRREARHSLLAYGFLRGTPYRAMELKCHEPPNWSEVLKMAERFGRGKYDNEFKVWMETPLPVAA